MCEYIVLIIYNLAHLKVRIGIMFGCFLRTMMTRERVNNFPKVMLYLLAIAIATCVHSLGSLQVHPPRAIEFMLFGRVQNGQNKKSDLYNPLQFTKSFAQAHFAQSAQPSVCVYVCVGVCIVRTSVFVQIGKLQCRAFKQLVLCLLNGRAASVQLRNYLFP